MIHEIKNLENLTNLKILFLKNNKISEIKGFENLINLETLDLANNYIRSISGLEHLPRLRALDLSGNKIDAVKGLENLSNLNDLNLFENPIIPWAMKYYMENKKSPEKFPVGDVTEEAINRFLGEFGQVMVQYCVKLNNKKVEVIEKLKTMMEVSSKIRIDMMRDIFDIDPKEFNNMLFNWAKEFGFKIDGDFIIVENADIEGFIADLDNQFELWRENEELKEGKI